MLYQHIFQNANRGPVHDPSAQGFLELARAGSAVWNAWRADHPATWDGVNNRWLAAVKWHPDIDLNNFAEINFSGFNFGDGADFSYQKFYSNSVVNFKGAVFGNDVKFEGVGFSRGVNFEGARFGNNARFNVRVYSGGGQLPRPNAAEWFGFENVRLGDNAYVGVELQWQHVSPGKVLVSLSNCEFGNDLRLAINNNGAGAFSFANSKFGSRANFTNANFRNAFADFKACQFGEDVCYYYCPIDTADFSNCRFGPNVDLTGNSFDRIDFSGAEFDGGVNFSNRQFNGRTNFHRASFKSAPQFHNCKLHQDTQFDEDSFPKDAIGTGDASRAYRTLKLEMSRIQATRQEQFFFRLEMREEQLELWREGGTSVVLHSVWNLSVDWRG